ncbi:unnamed protein product [Triticum turgidum subsp. durum]|uniref:Annexin n=1 Tax=Triticum turgidum subsp. durum TaxID=4567 RepID=A0A9R1B2M3_TRITD|nr:unnamed protein product [Triticum turgidum subsp. durum]
MATLSVPAAVPAVAEDCEQLRKAFAGWGTNERLIVSILAHRDAAQRRAIRRAYAEAYGEELLRAIGDEIHGKFELLVPLVSAYRYDGPEVNTSLAHSEAKLLNGKINEKAYSDDEVVRILTTRSKAQLLATFNSYNDQFSHPITKDLKEDPKNEFLSTLRAIIRCFTCPDRYFEKVVRLALGGVGTDEDTLTRVITTRAEVDLKVIKEAYQKRNSVPLEKAVSKETSRDYEDMMLALLGAEY